MLSIYRPDDNEIGMDALEEVKWKNDGLSPNEIKEKQDERFLGRTYVTVRYRTKCEYEGKES